MSNDRAKQVGWCVALLAVAGCAAGCGSSSGSSAMARTNTTTATTIPAALASGGTITIKNFAFGTPITVKPGATVTVKNVGVETHTLSADDAQFDTGNIAGGTSVTFVAPTMSGTYAFHCNFHDMHGRLIVAA